MSTRSGRSAPPSAKQSATRALFGIDSHGRRVDQITIRNAHGMRVEVLTLGGIVRSLEAPDRDGVPGDVVLGFDSLAGYEADELYLGTLVGRYANRIAMGRFAIDGRSYALTRNDGDNHLHGGAHGFNRAIWQARTFSTRHAVGATLAYESPAGDEGYPGTLTVRVTYSLTDQNEFAVDYFAATTAPTVVSLTQHSYFNLSAIPETDVLGHELTVYASRFLPVDAKQIPTGELREVEGTAFDFRTPRAIGSHIDDADEQLRHGHGYDHTFAIDPREIEVAPAVRLVDPGSGRSLEVLTTMPGVQVCTGNVFPPNLTGKRGERIVPHAGIALETQHFPDAPNRPRFPSPVIRPGEPFLSRTVYRFGIAR